VANEEDVPRFSLRRGARFLETLRDQPESEADDERWFADLVHDEPGVDPGRSEGNAAGDADPVGQTGVVGQAGVVGQTGVVGETEPAGDQPEPEIALHRRFAVEGTVGGPEVALESPSELAPPPAALGEESGGSNYKRKLEALAAAAFEPPSPPTDLSPEQVSQPAPPEEDRPVHDAPDQEPVRDAVSVLAEHLANLEEALARASAACTAARMVLSQGQAQLDHPSSIVAVATPHTEAHRHPPEAPAVSRLATPLRRLGSVTLRDLFNPV